jgi:hypothetical protein
MRRYSIPAPHSLLRPVLHSFLFPALLTLGGCSLLSTPDPGEKEPEATKASQATPNQTLRLGVYLARGSLFSAPEFEQYKVSGNSLFVECGIIRGGRAVAKAQNILSLSTGAEEALRTLEQDLSTYLETENPSLASQELGSFGFMHPGEATIHLSPGSSSPSPGSGEVKTTIDEISSSSNSSPVRKLVVGLRTIARESLKSRGGSEEPLCGNTSFYGIE